MGGIIVIDFIDMTQGLNRRKLFEKLRDEMKRDRAKHSILPPSKFGLVQITRYADATGADTRHLVLFDRRPEWRDKPWTERLGWETRTAPDKKPVVVVWA